VHLAATHAVPALARVAAMPADAIQEHVVERHHVAHGKQFPERSWFQQLSLKLEQ
jgi:hypothetical protein